MRNKYTGINLGPIVSTLSMARRPRELWSASYLFSYLMECIIDQVNGKYKIISPARVENFKLGIGLYPDRLFIKGELSNVEEILDSAWGKIESLDSSLSREYFNIMVTSCEASKDSDAIKVLNSQFDTLELFNIAKEESDTQSVYNFITEATESKLYNKATGKQKFEVETLAEIAAKSLSNYPKWNELRKFLRSEDEKIGYNNYKDQLKGYHKYICIVQADGDNIGKTVSNSGLKDGDVEKLSGSLLKYGTKACEQIVKYGGMPIYAGGDDLLFIAPVVGVGEKHIFDLIAEIDTAFGCVQDTVEQFKLKDDNDVFIKASMSYGISMTYYKFPLYEALENARNLLFGKAKKTPQKNAIAVNLQKHSGSSFSACFSKYVKDIYQAFLTVIENTDDEKTVSAVAHKIRNNEALLKIINSKGQETVELRLNALFEKYFDFKAEEHAPYYKSVKDLLRVKLNKVEQDQNYDLLAATIYSLLRIAKFIKGEELRDE